MGTQPTSPLDQPTWEPPSPGVYTRSLRFGEWVSEPVTPLFESWLLSRLEARLHANLQALIDTDAAFRTAFEALTPGRQREYNLQIGAAKQATTRQARVEKFAPRILAGKGFRDR